MKKYLLSFSLISLLFLNGFSQTVKNVQARTDKNQVIITYDLVSSVDGQKFDIEIKSSINNFTTLLEKVSGDVGPDQSPGLGKTITWAALSEQGNFSGSVSFEVTATLTFSPLNVTNPTVGSSGKIGKPLDVKWQGGSSDRNLKMTILQGTSTITDIPNVGSSGSYSWKVPKTLVKGDNYQIKLFDPSKPNDAAMSAKFQLKKTSILVYVIPAAVLLGVGVAVLLGGGDCENPCDASCSNYNPSDPTCTTPGTELVAPPPPPGG